MPATSMNLLASWARLGNKSKEQLEKPTVERPTSPSLPPETGRERVTAAEAADPLPCRHSLDLLHSADIGQPKNVPTSDGEHTSTRAHTEGAVTGESKLSLHSLGPGNNAASDALPDLPKLSPGALPEQSPLGPKLKHAKSFFSTFALAKKIRIRKKGPVQLDHELGKSAPPRTPSPRQGSHRPQAVPIRLSDDIVSRQRREDALRARGLLPPRDLSAVEADEDRRIDARQKNGASFSSSDSEPSDADDIARAWRSRNLKWLSQSVPNLDTLEDPMTQVSSPTDASSHSGGLPELLATGADADALLPLLSSPSITKFLSLDPHCSPARSFKAASSGESNSHTDSLSSRADSPNSISLEEPMLPSSCLEDVPIDGPTGGVSEDVKTTSTQSAPSSPVPSRPSGSEKPQASAPSLPSQRSVSPTQPEDLQQTPSSPELPSEPRIEPSLKPAVRLPEPLDVTSQAQVSAPALSPLLLFPIVPDASLASPVTPTLSPSVCYSSSETSDHTPAADNGDLIASPASDFMPIKDRRADITPFSAKNSEGVVLSQEVILEGPEPFPDEEDLDPFARPMSPPQVLQVPTVIKPPSRPSNLKTRAMTLGQPPSADVSKSATTINLRRTFTNVLFRRPRAPTTMSRSPVGATFSSLSPPPSPLFLKVHSGSTIVEEASRIDDDEVRRLSELAFMT